MREDDMKLIAGLGDWGKSDALMQKALARTFGTVLERKYAEFQECKAQMKECISKNYGDALVPRTPKRAKPHANLMEQINRFKTISLMPDDTENTPLRATEAADAEMMAQNSIERNGSIVMVNEKDADPYKFNPDNDDVQRTADAFTSDATKGKTKALKYVNKTPVQPSTSRPKRIVRSPPNKGPRPSVQRQQKIKQIQEKTEQAKKQREEYLREKAERIKREREEARQRVEQNNRIKEAEQRERELQREREEKRLREYRTEQERLVHTPSRGLPLASKITPKHPTAAMPQFKSTPRQIFVPAKRSKTIELREAASADMQKANKKEETQKKLEEEIREQQRREEELREQRRIERLEKEEREKELREQNRVEEERREHERREHERQERERQEKERLEHERREKERLEKEKREKERREKEQREKELREKEKAKKAKNVSVYDMTPDKIYLPSTKDNYNVDDLSSNDETDNEDKPRKDVPKWAQKRELAIKVAAMRSLIPEENRAKYFGRMKQPTVEDFFKSQLKQYPLRSSSAIWTSPMSDPTPGEEDLTNGRIVLYGCGVLAGVCGVFAIGFVFGQRIAYRSSRCNHRIKLDSDKVVDSIDIQDLEGKAAFHIVTVHTSNIIRTQEITLGR
ncbi:inner centromere protein, ARK binding region domain-containing protein [Ditylenchus destructor]|nr:inner centromere protein, ARK binding region domain-containing protein [Ditylenchus destructor]